MASIEEVISQHNRNPQGCFICQNEDAVHHVASNIAGTEYDCPICGKYIVLRSFCQTIFNDGEYREEFFAKAPAVAALRELDGRDNYTLSFRPVGTSMVATINDDDFLKEYPADFLQKLDKALLNIGRLTHFDPSQNCDIDNKKFQYLFCNDKNEARNLMHFLIQEGYVVGQETCSSQRYFCSQISLTLHGLRQALALNKLSSNQFGFVAMWYDLHTKRYKDAVKQAINKAGYLPYIANEDIYNDQIMPRVLNKIGESRFVIADLTSVLEEDGKNSSGVRGGVYYEAGYAKGLGLEVILTCEEQAEKRIHFDLKQFKSLYWKEEDGKIKVGENDFIDALAQQIIFTVGKGPFYKEVSDV